MMYDLVLHPDDRLRRKCDPVSRVDAKTATVVRDMLETMGFEERGIGLAAPQVGILERMLVCDVRDGTGPRALINPEITWRSDTLVKRTEGCLSIPDVFAEVERPDAIIVKYTDERGAPQEWKADGWWATVVQHEMDHLDGILFTDHLSALKREMILKKYFKQLRIKE